MSRSAPSSDPPASTSKGLPLIEGDEYLKQLSRHIRTHAAALAAASPGAPRRIVSSSGNSAASWIGLGSSGPPAAVTLRLDPHHLFWLLLKYEELGIDVGPLDVKAKVPARPTSYGAWTEKDKSETASIFSSMSGLSLGSGWFGGKGNVAKVNIKEETKYLFSTFTKLPALRLTPTSNPTSSKSGPMQLVKGFEDLPHENAVPLGCFKNLQVLQVEDLDPRSFIGWDRLSEGLRSLEVRRTGLEDVEHLLVDAVVGDVRRRERRDRQRQEAEAERRDDDGRGSAAERSLRPPSSTTSSSRSSRSPPTALPPLAWRFLRHLCLADNALTFLPTGPLTALVSLASLDLSSNLLIAVPAGLSTLTELRSLSLADNMIESVLGIYQTIGNVHTINFSRNRLTSLCGLERLFALVRLDVRHNLLSESLEISRLAQLPHLTHLWASENPFIHVEVDWRRRCFQYFVDEGRQVEEPLDRGGLILDGSGPSFNERRSLVRKPATKPDLPIAAPQPVKTVVRSPDFGPRSKPTSPAKPDDRPLSPTSDSSSHASPDLPATGAPIKVVRAAGRQKQRKAAARVINLGAPSNGTSAKATQNGSSNHLRSPSQPVSSLEPTNAGGTNGDKRSATVGRSSKLRNQVKASDIFGPEGGRPAVTGADPIDRSRSPEAAGEAFRKRVEALRSEVGEGWLKVLGESDWASPSQEGPPSTTPSPKAPQAELDAPGSAVPAVKVVRKKGKAKQK